MKVLNQDFKFKNLTYDELIINLDRLSRFKLPEISYKRVFFDIILKCSISPKFTKSELEELDAKIVSSLVKSIWNSSVDALWGKSEDNTFKVLEATSLNTYMNIDNYTKTLIRTKLNIGKLLSNSSYENLPLNLKFLHKNMYSNDIADIIKTSVENKLLFPIRKLIIVEGITEEILLPILASKLGLDFNERGIFILGSGGKSKSPVLYNDLKEKLKIPIILLFDSDASDICQTLKKNINKKDKLICLDKGEFEDILSLNLIKRTLNNEYEPIFPVTISEIKLYNKRCEFLQEFFRSRQLGEFKKAKFAKLLSNNIKYNTDISEEIKQLIDNIILER